MSGHLSRREREIMDVIYRRGRASAEEVREDLGGELSNSAVRTMLGILVEKGCLEREAEGKRYLYLPTRSASAAGLDALRDVMKTFFSGSAERTVAALLDAADSELEPEEYDRIEAIIEAARKEEGGNA